MRYLLHPFQLTMAATSVILAAASITLIMVSDPEDDPQARAVGWIGILTVVVLVILVTGLSLRAERDAQRDAQRDELRAEVLALVRLETRRIAADLRDITGLGHGDNGPQRTHHLN